MKVFLVPFLLSLCTEWKHQSFLGLCPTPSRTLLDPIWISRWLLYDFYNYWPTEKSLFAALYILYIHPYDKLHVCILILVIMCWLVLKIFWKNFCLQKSRFQKDFSVGCFVTIRRFSYDVTYALPLLFSYIEFEQIRLSLT